MSRALLALLAALAAALALAGPAAAASRYVSLGDSYAAGPLIPVQLPPFGCLKSSNDYGHLTQQQLRFPEYRDPSCSGAKTNHMTPPQFVSLTADTAMVTLTIGGNDIGFSSIAQDCFVTQPSAGSPCKDKYTAGGQDQISQRIADTAPKVAGVLAGIAARSPQAKTYVVNYSAIFPHEGPGCYPQMPVAEGDVPWLRAKQEELNAMLATQATANGARLVDVYAASRGHDACSLPGFRWVEPVTPASPAAPVHPNLIGMKAMAALIVAATRQ